ncbi:unnamed protein product [Alopecurus aequalis]
MADAAITTVLSKLAEIVASEIRLQHQVVDNIILLRDRLEWLQAFVRDADQKRRAGTDGLTRVWVHQTRNVAFEVEDALDDFFHEEDRRRHCKTLHRYSIGFITKFIVRHGLYDRIKMIKRRLDQISENQKGYNVVHTPSMLPSSNTAIAAWRDDLENAVGFDEDVMTLMGLLNHEDQHAHKPMFISIVGESGAGKNTLARIISRLMTSDRTVVIRCNLEAGSSTEDDLKEVNCRLSLMFGCPLLHGCPMDERDVAESSTCGIRNKLGACLNGIRYLFILGGISLKTTLNCMRAILPSPKVHDSGGQVMLMLDTENEELVLLAGLLRFKEKPGQWNAVLQQLKPNNNGSAQDSGGEGLLNRQMTSSDQQLCSGTRRAMEIIFWASFEDLPNNLKSCFLYFVGYPRNFTHSADTMVRLWIAEGFISRQKGKTMEEVGYDYLKELVLRCLVEVEEMKVGGGISLVRIHRSLMGFLLSEVRESGFMEIHDIDEALVQSSVRRLSVQSDNGTRYTSSFASNNKFPKHRSFICHIITDDKDQHHHDLKFLLWSRFLRVLSVHGLGLTELPDQIGDMIQLRYLRVDCKSLECLPPSIAKLHNLQTLDITNTQVEQIHMDFWNIKTIRHVLTSNLTLTTTNPVCEEGQGCGELQTLHGVKPDQTDSWSETCLLLKMASLRSLEMHGFEYSKHGGRAFKAALGYMNHLVHLKLKGDVIPSCVLTDPRIRSLQTMVIHAIVNWDHRASDDIRIPLIRPNLIQLNLSDSCVLPEFLGSQLANILVVRD